MFQIYHLPAVILSSVAASLSVVTGLLRRDEEWGAEITWLLVVFGVGLSIAAALAAAAH